jgi:hypothetical protein
MTEELANVVVVPYARFLECQARRRGFRPSPHDQPPSGDGDVTPELAEAAAALPPARPAPRPGS